MKGYIIALDQGTTSSRSIVFDEQGKTVELSGGEISLILPE
jgi:glycerol kinase